MTGPSQHEYGPRPLEDQTWRRHHRPRRTAAMDYARDGASVTSGASRRRRKAVARRRWVTELAERWATR